MTVDRAELAGTGAALAFHAALIAALSFSLAHVVNPPEPPPMEVEMVDEIGLQPAAPAATLTPPPQAQAPELAETPPPPQPEAAPTPVVQPTPQPRVAPANTLAAQVAQLRPTPPRPQPAKAAPAQPAPARSAQPRASRIGADFLKGIADAPRSAAPAKAAASIFNAQAQMNVGQAILQQAKRCAARETFLGEGANRVRLKINLAFARDGHLLRAPTVLGRSGDPELVAKYGDLLEDQIRRIFADCAPFRLPPELYDTGNGGWKNFTFSYRVD